MTRHSRLSMALLLLGSFVHSAAAEQPEKKPNVLMIVVDDLNVDLGCYGNRHVKTPHIDRLAARSTRFDRAYCQYALCAPSRWSFLSGLHADTTGIYEFKTLLREKRPKVVFLPQLFREHGYFAAGMGKVFHDERQSDREKSWDFYQDKMGEDAQEAAAVKERYKYKEGMRPFTWHRLDGPEEKTRDGQAARGIARHIEEQAKAGKPFFLAAGFHRPHLPWAAPAPYFDLYRDAKIPEPTDPALKHIPEIALMTELVGNPPPKSRTEAIAAYYACISFVDAQVGILLDSLDRHKLWDNTIVVFLSDHGYHLGDHAGLWAKLTIFEYGCRVPLLIAAPGHAGGKSSLRTVQLIDVYPTVAELAGQKTPADVEGKSLVPLLTQPDAAWDRPAHSLVHHKGIEGRSVRNERFRYNEWDGGKMGVELYDHASDAGESVNRAEDPAYREAIAAMKRLMRRP